MSHDERNREEWLKEEEIKNEIFMQQMRVIGEKLKSQKMNYMVNPVAFQAVENVTKFFKEKSDKYVNRFKNTPYEAEPYQFVTKDATSHPSISASYWIVIETTDEMGFSFNKGELEKLIELGNGLISGMTIYPATDLEGNFYGKTRLSIEISDFFILIPN